MLLLLVEFLVCSAVIVWCGGSLSRYGDVIAEKAGLGRAWIGLILMATVTSLPELINGISSVTIAGVPDIALGDVMGSCLFNVTLIAVIDVFHTPGPIFSRAGPGHILSAGFGIILISIPAIFILVPGTVPSLGPVGFYTPVIILVYLVGIKTVYSFEKAEIEEYVEATLYGHISTGEAAARYAFNAFVIIVAATFLPFLGARLATATGLGQGFVGTFFIGLTTSLPELVVSIAAVRIGAADMAIANLLGSNMFNILILAVDDLFYSKGVLLDAVSGTHAVSAFMAVIATAVAVVALSYRLTRKSFFRIGWGSVALMVNFLAAVALMYILRGDTL